GWRPSGDSLTVVPWSSKLAVSIGRGIRAETKGYARLPEKARTSFATKLNRHGDSRCRRGLFSRMCGADIRSTDFANA
ncbi:MAG: hypothetical protein WB470_02690, partial [Candidatus Acidiferrales bacterium]